MLRDKKSGKIGTEKEMKRERERESIMKKEMKKREEKKENKGSGDSVCQDANLLWFSGKRCTPHGESRGPL